jgi:peptidoglycan/LPS O-acetylase OafA/YrhL
MIAAPNPNGGDKNEGLVPLEQLLTNPSESKRTAHWLALDGARGLAVLLVLLDHASDAEMRLFAGADFNRAGKYGVYLFFVLSAFLLTYQFYVRPREEFLQARTWFNYAARRFLRIFPTYCVVVLAMIAMGKLQSDDFATHLLLRDGKGAFWTIPVEVKFYLLLPLIVLALFWAGRKHWLWGIAAAVVAVAGSAGLLVLEKPWSLQENVLLAPNLVTFVMGIIAAIAYGRLQKSPALQRWNGWLELAAGLAAMGIIIRIPSIYNVLFPSDDPVGKLGYDAAICGVLWAIFILGIVLGSGRLSRAMQWRPLRFLGLISFSAYLWHGRFLSDFDDLPVPPPLRLLVFLVVVIAVATVSYFLFERPLLRIRPRSSDSKS